MTVSKKILCRCVLWLLPVCLVFSKEKYALIIGINGYQSPRIRALHYSEPDAMYIREALLRFARYKPQNVQMILGREATYGSIKDKIYWLGDVAKPEDDVFFYYSGHGTRVLDRSGKHKDGMNEAICPYETDIQKPSTVVLTDDIGYWFNQILSKQIIMVFDCCYSGGAAGRSLEDDGSKGIDMAGVDQSRDVLNFENDFYARDLALNNKFLLTASDANEKSYENPRLGHGIFSFYLGEAMRGEADANSDKEVTTEELYQYTNKKTLEFVQSINQKQTPMAFGDLRDAVVCEINRQMCNLKLFDPDLNLIVLGTAENVVREGEILVLKKNVQTYARDIEIDDMNIFKLQVTKVQPGSAQTKVIERYFQNVQIDPSRYGDYYAEKLEMGKIYIMTQPWSVVAIDGKVIGETPVVIPEVPAGEHTLEFRIGETGFPKMVQKKVEVKGNDKLRIIEQFPKEKAY